jgi:sulfite dehydrogenase (quinone) subunit SoeC
MHPALSVIFFTAVSGTGYGLLFLLGTAVAIEPRGLDPVGTLLALGLGIAFAAAGLMSSLAHLGQPRRAWRAFSQWRSSWLSREGIAAVVCFVPALVLYALVWHYALDMAMGALDAHVVLALRAGGTALAACAALTVFCTARIYTSLKTIGAWHNAFVLPGYLLFALLGGAAWLWLLSLLAGGAPPLLTRGLPVTVAGSALAAALLKRAYWRFVDRAPAVATAESATGLGRFGRVHGVEAPHTEENYLTHEMVFVLARRHSARLRAIAAWLFAVLPAALALIGLVGASAAANLAAAIAAVPLVTGGTFIERWLFFAEAKHVVMLYYPAARN